jgi:threonine aldolase
MLAFLTDDLWLTSATRANANAARLVKGLQAIPAASFLHAPQANMVFVNLPRATHQRLHDAGAVYYIWSGSLEGDDPAAPLAARLVCDWSIGHDQIDQFLGIAAG